MNHPSAQTPEPVAIVIIGATGDLSQRLLFPALYRLFSEGAISSSLAIVGMSRRGMTHEQFRTFARDGVGRDVAIDAASWGRFAERLFYVSADSMKEADYAHVARTLAVKAGAPNSSRPTHNSTKASAPRQECFHADFGKGVMTTIFVPNEALRIRRMT